MKPAAVVVEARTLAAVDFLADEEVAGLEVVLCIVVESFDVDLKAGLDVVGRAVDLTDAELVRTNCGDAETLATFVNGAPVADVTVGQNAVDEAPTTGAATKPEVEISAAGPPTIGAAA